MLEKTPLAEQEFNGFYDDTTRRLQEQIVELKTKIQELRSQIDWLERENAKYL